MRERVIVMVMLKNCTLCPRNCGADRTNGTGFCGATDKVKVARAALHFWEEPCISGNRGSGTVFFSGCNLACCYCQNYCISREGKGKEISISRLAEIFLELQQKGAHNINLVTPTPYIPHIKEAVDIVRENLEIPVVFNTGGYEKPQIIQELKGYCDVFLTDVKYKSSVLSDKFSKALDYFECSVASLERMIELCGKPRYDADGMLLSGVIVRHLVLPGSRKDSVEILEELKNSFGTDMFILSLMSQFTPNGHLDAFPEINRKITSFEYNAVVDAALELGFDNAYVQEKSSAAEEYTPPFDLSGV